MGGRAPARMDGSAVSANPSSIETNASDDLKAADRALLTRACQVYWDIKILLDNHRTRGALARWRTLYEIAAVRLHIGRDESLATRYLDYIHIEQLRKMQLHNELREEWKERLLERETQTAERHAPFTPEEIEAKQTLVKSLTARFGKQYGKFPMGWNGGKRIRKMVEGTELDFLYVVYELAHDEIHDKPFDPLSVPALDFNIQMPAISLILSAVGRPPDKDELVRLPRTLNIRDEEKRSVHHACKVCEGVFD